MSRTARHWKTGILVSVIIVRNLPSTFLINRTVYVSRKTHKRDHFTVVCLVSWPLNETEAGVDLVLIETYLLFFC